MVKGNRRQVVNEDGDIEFVEVVTIGWNPLWNLSGFRIIRTGMDFVEIQQESGKADLGQVKLGLKEIWGLTKGSNCPFLHISAVVRMFDHETCDLEIGYGHGEEVRERRMFSFADEKARETGSVSVAGWSKHSTKYAGVYQYGDKYRVWLTVDHRSRYFGTYGDIEEAARRADGVMKEAGRPIGCLNFQLN
jgi:hypothetical protein